MEAANLFESTKTANYSREEAIALYGRVKEWARSESNRLRETILVPVFSGNMCVLHNSMIAYEQGQPWREMPRNYYRLGKFYEWKQNQIWRESERLSKHFARFF